MLKAAEASKVAADEVEKKAEVKKRAAEALDIAKAALFVAKAELRADPKNPQKIQDVNEKEQVYQKALEAEVKATAEAKLLPHPRDAAALAFMQTVRNDRKKTTVAEFVDEVVGEMVETLDEDLTNQFNQLIAEAVDGKRPMPEGATSESARGNCAAADNWPSPGC